MATVATSAAAASGVGGRSVGSGASSPRGSVVGRLSMVPGATRSSSSSASVSNKYQGVLPSFSDLLWSPDINGDVMNQPIGGAMVS